MRPAKISGPPTPYRWTIDEYQQLGSIGRFDGCRVILIDGEILVQPLGAPPHDLSRGLISDFFWKECPPGYHTRSYSGFDIGIQNDPRPDLAIVPGAIRDYTHRNPTTAALVIEVADSSLLLDTTRKVELYASAMVPDYWVIDLEGNRLLVFRDADPLPTGLGIHAYRTHLTLCPTDFIAPLAIPKVNIRVGDLLP